MKQLNLSVRDKTVLGFIVAGEIFSVYYAMGEDANPARVMMYNTIPALMFIIFTLGKIFECIRALNGDVQKVLENNSVIRNVLTPVQLPNPSSNTQYNVSSIERLLSSIEYDEHRTVFDYVVESSTNETLVTNLVRTQDVILNSLSTLTLEETCPR